MYLHHTTLIALQLQQLLLPQLQLQVQVHCIALHYANYTAARYSYKCKCNYNDATLHNITLY